MAETILTTALETVRDLLIHEANFLFGVRDEVEEIERTLIQMKIFLEYADSKQEEDKMLGYKVAAIRKISEEVEDVLETFAIEVESTRQNRGVDKNALKRCACIFKEGRALHKIGSEIVSIKTKIANLTNSLPLFDMPKEESSNSAQEKNNRWQRQTSHFDENIVGMEEDIKQLVFHLVNNVINEGNQNQYSGGCPCVVSIWGMGGIGKTCLAKKVYNHDQVVRCFDLFSWACITPDFQLRDALEEILIGLVPLKWKQTEIKNLIDQELLDRWRKEGIKNLSDKELAQMISELLVTKKCLVIIDDIWTIHAWDSLKLAFPGGERRTAGSKILLTTRSKAVASHANPTGFIYELRCLNEEESWDLLQKKAFSKTDIGGDFRVDPRFEEVGRKIVRHCKGLPLAVVVLGGILVTKETYEEWMMVLQNIKTYLTKGESIGEAGVLLKVLDLSYKNLTYQLKQCFLYFCNFQEDSEIETRKLYHMWVAEGVISSYDRGEAETMIDVAQRYLEELVHRCMVQVQFKGSWISRKRFKSCRLHDLMRDLCLSKAKEGNLLNAIENESRSNSSTTSKLRRVSRYSSKFTLSHLSSTINDFKSLRVLDMEGLSYHSYAEMKIVMGKLMQLRYLSFKNMNYTKLPSSIGNLGYLQALDLRSDACWWIPNVLWKLQMLRHLYLPKIFECDASKLRLDSLSNLETLVNFHPVLCDVKDLVKLNNLRELKVHEMREIEDLSYLETAITSTNSLLQHSKIRLIMCSKVYSEEELTILRKLLDCHHLHHLSIGGPISHLEHYHFSPSLTKLKLYGSKLQEDPMPKLEKLLSLTHLHMGLGSFLRNEMVCSSIGFPHLMLLELYFLPNLEDWRVDEGAFPKLSHMKIDCCQKLKMIPDGLMFITTLKELSIGQMPKEFTNRVQVVNGIKGPDFHKVRHVPSIIFRDHIQHMD